MTIAIDMRSSQEGIGGVAEYTRMVAYHAITRFPQHNFVLFYSGMSARPDAMHTGHANARTYVHAKPNKITNALLRFVARPYLDDVVSHAVDQPIDAWFLPNINFISLRPQTPLVTTIHDLSFETYPEVFGRKQLMWHAAVDPRGILNRSNHVLAVSHHTKGDLTRHFGIDPQRITVTHLGLTLGYERTSTTHPAISRGRYILAQAAHNPRKNIESVIQGYRLLRQRYPDMSDVSLHIMGKGGPWQRGLRALPEAIQKSIVIHESPDTQTSVSLMQSASVFVYPSLYEGFGLPILEAMAAGTPVITSANSAIIETAGDGALYTDPYNATAMGNAMYALLSDQTLRNTLQQKAQNHHNQFDWRNTADTTVAALESAAQTTITV